MRRANAASAVSPPGPSAAPGRAGTRVVAGAGYGALLLLSLLVFSFAWIPVLIVGGVLAYVELARLARRAFRGAALGAALIVGGLYLAGGLAALAQLQFATAGEPGTVAPSFAWALLALAVTWAADISAYAVGSRIGRRRIAPLLSPRKTLEGTVAGIAAAALVALAFGAVYGLAPAAVAIVALFAGPAALAGDLIESALKRAAGAKDSGGIIPGHGGVLDRIDSLLLVAPVVYLGFVVARSGMMGR
ncbi:MAG: phosphatidate cytidylyltransferase [Chloroflexota bacterium]|nr:phosphatidate cytidylyltransferase [Chloroflexota bacterium]